ncbi:MAG: thiamine pyrophosphate-dependent enzyme [archaeon]|nr:thiamine pyrophosphate-dependent enzyme [archaeon]
MKKELNTGVKSTWCPGCNNFMVLAGLKNAIAKELEKSDKDDIAIVTGIGCHAKLFDYINMNGINTLHGRVLPMCLGIKTGNPNLKVIGFSGDGDAYAEGIEHLIHAARYNADVKYVVMNNQVFALTVGQPTPTTKLGFKGKTNPEGVKLSPLNPIRIMLASGASFVARVSSDVKQIEWILEEAFKHKGFAFIEILQSCLIFNNINLKEKMYLLEKEGHNKGDMGSAMKKAEEFNYDSTDKIPIGIFYQKEREIFEDKFKQLKDLKNKGISWKDIQR